MQVTQFSSARHLSLYEGRGEPAASERTSFGGSAVPQCLGCLQPQLNSLKTVDWQKVRIQELLTDAEKLQGGPPRTMEVELMRDLVHSVTCGDEVSVFGFVRVMKGEQVTRTQSGIVMLYIDAISVENHSREGLEPGRQVNVCSANSAISQLPQHHRGSACMLYKIDFPACLPEYVRTA